MDAHLPSVCESCVEEYWQLGPDKFVHLPALCPCIGTIPQISLNHAGRLELHVTDERMLEEDIQRIEL
jgi:hypothetical protein